MPILGQMGIAKRLWTVVIVLSLGLLGHGSSFAYTRLDAVGAAARQTESVRVPQLGEAAAMELNITRISLQLRHAILSRTAEERATALADIAAKRKLVEASAADYKASLFTDRGKAMFANLPPELAQMWQKAEENIALIQADKKEEAFAYLVDHTIPARNKVLAVLDDMVKYQRASLVGRRRTDRLPGQQHAGHAGDDGAGVRAGAGDVGRLRGPHAAPPGRAVAGSGRADT